MEIRRVPAGLRRLRWHSSSVPVPNAVERGSAPTVTWVSPSSGPAAGGTSVTISGTGFASGATVYFGPAPATNVSVASPTSITATSPAGTRTVDVTVTVAGQTSATSSANQLSYQARPTVTGVSPSSGPAAGGTSVTISGTGFASGATVYFGPAPATNVSVASPTSITATSPAGTRTVDATVTVAGQTSATSSADQFSYQATSVTATASVSPTSYTGGDCPATFTFSGTITSGVLRR